MNTRKLLQVLLVCALLPIVPAAVAQDEVYEVGDRIKDAAITARIETTFLLNKHLNPLAIQTQTRNGVVTLTGIVDDQIKKSLAERLAASVDGVHEVVNDLLVEGQEPPEETPRPADEEVTPVVPEPDVATEEAPERPEWSTRVKSETLRADVLSRLMYHEGLRGAEIDVEIEGGGEVELNGEVRTPEQKQLAERLVREVSGVREVQNDLDVDAEDVDDAEDNYRFHINTDDVMARLGDEWVEKRVETNIALNKHVNLASVDVEVDDGVCVITGDVIAEQQRDLVTRIAESTPGVASVENRLTVSDWKE